MFGIDSYTRIVSALTLRAEEIVPSGLAVIVYSLVYVLTLIAEEIVYMFDIYSLLTLSK